MIANPTASSLTGPTQKDNHRLAWQVLPLRSLPCVWKHLRHSSTNSHGKWFKIKPPGYGPQILVHVSIYQGNPFWVPIFDPRPHGGTHVCLVGSFAFLASRGPSLQYHGQADLVPVRHGVRQAAEHLAPRAPPLSDDKMGRHRWPFGKIDGPGKWDKTHLNHCHLFFSQTNLTRTPMIVGLPQFGAKKCPLTNYLTEEQWTQPACQVMADLPDQKQHI